MLGVCVCMKKAPTTVCGRFTTTFPLDNITFALEFMVIVQVPSIKFKRSRQLNLNLCVRVCVCFGMSVAREGADGNKWGYVLLSTCGKEQRASPNHRTYANEIKRSRCRSFSPSPIIFARNWQKWNYLSFHFAATRVQCISFYACWNVRARLSVCLRYV